MYEIIKKRHYLWVIANLYYALPNYTLQTTCFDYTLPVRSLKLTVSLASRNRKQFPSTVPPIPSVTEMKHWGGLTIGQPSSSSVVKRRSLQWAFAFQRRSWRLGSMKTDSYYVRKGTFRIRFDQFGAATRSPIDDGRTIDKRALCKATLCFSGVSIRRDQNDPRAWFVRETADYRKRNPRGYSDRSGGRPWSVANV